MDTKSIEKYITINAPANEVWDMLTNEQKIRGWASAFGEGMHAETDWAEGSEIVWKDGNDSICATGIIAINKPNETIHVDFFGKTNPQLQSPTGRSSETYSLKKVNDAIELSIEAGPLSDDELAEVEDMWEKAVQKMKAIAEGKLE